MKNRINLMHALQKLFRLNDTNWMRHANPWSVYTRYSALPLILLSIWSKCWIDNFWYLALGLSIIWTFVNPVLFKKPRSTNNWASHCVFGERVYINRKKIDIPKHHKTPIIPIQNTIAGIGFVVSIIAASQYEFWVMMFGLSLAILGKTWFLDRMVWLFHDMKDKNEEYHNWQYTHK